MNQSRKKLRICLFCVVLTAVIIGAGYYYLEVQGTKHTGQGTLITHVNTKIGTPW
ncbi:MAG: hypothetical protein RR799_00870 [Lachnospiraceae bacterium]